MLNIFSCACWPSVCPPWKNVHSRVLPIFQLGCLGSFFFFFYWVVWAGYIFFVLTPYHSYHLKMFSPIQLIVFLFCWWLPLTCKSFKFTYVPFVYFFFYFLCLGDSSKILLPFMSNSVFSSRCSMVSGLTCRSLIQF